MKNRFRNILLVLVPLIVAIIVLYPTYNSSQLEDLRDGYLERARLAETPTDSFRIMDEFRQNYGEEYLKTRANRLQLGLDLRGGMYVTLEVDVLKLIEETAQKEALDEVFQEVMKATADEVELSDENIIDVFVRNFNKIATPEGRSLISYFDIGDISDASDERIIETLRNNADAAITQAQEVIRQRIDKYGVAEPNIQLQGNRRILLELPGVTDESQIRNLLETTARLEFKLVRNNKELVEAFRKIDAYVSKNNVLSDNNASIENLTDTKISDLDFEENKEEIKSENIEDIVESEISDDNPEDLDTNNNEDTTMADNNQDTNNLDTTTEEKSQEEYYREYQNNHPFTILFSTFFSPGENQKSQPVSYDIESFPQGRYFFRISKDSLDKFNLYLNDPNIKALLPPGVEIAFSAKGEEGEYEGSTFKLFDMYGLKAEPELLGDVIVDAQKNIDPTTNGWVVSMRMNTDGSEKWAKITGANVGKQIAIVLDGNVYSAPNVITKITGGSSQISGMANAKEASLLEIVLKAGALKAPVQIIEEKVVGASLGDDSISAGINSTLFAFLLVILFMIIYYAKGGAIANVALFVNISIIITVLAALKGTLSLPGIAGVVLTMGMAVDANILIFERIREEIDRGRSIRSAIDEGFSKALSAILDSNITTFITGLILYYIGTGLIKGFALTLMIGILGTLFTAIMVTRALIELTMAKDSSTYNFGQPK